LNDKPFTNGAGVPFATAPPIRTDLVRWEFAQFEPISVTDFIVAERHESINSLPFLTFPKHTLLLKVLKSEVGFYYGQARRLTRYSLIYNPDNWHEKIANWGNAFNDAAGKQHKYRYYSGDPDNKESNNTIHFGPLGQRDVPVDSVFFPQDGEPTGGFEVVAINGVDQTFAIKPPDNTLYFIEFRVHTELNFNDFLRIR
jgi:hypothetical protein